MSSFACIGYYINFQQYVSVICAISDCYYYHGAEPAFSSSLPGERRKLSGGGAQTDNALCTRKTSYRSWVSNTSRVLNRSQGQRGLLLEVLRCNVNVNVKT